MILRIIKILFYIALLILILAVSVNIWLKTNTAKKLISKQITGLIKDQTGYDLIIDNLNISILTNIKCDKIILSNNSNINSSTSINTPNTNDFINNSEILLLAEKLNIDISPIALLLWEVNISNITLEKLILSTTAISANQNNSDFNAKKEGSSENNSFLTIQEQDNESILSYINALPDVTLQSIIVDEVIITESIQSDLVLQDDLSSKSDLASQNNNIAHPNNLSLYLKGYVRIFDNLEKMKLITQAEIINNQNEYMNGTTLSFIMSFDTEDQLLQIQNIELASPAITATGDFLAQFDNKAQISGMIKYNAPILQTELVKNLPESKATANGFIEISGNLEHIILKTDGLITADFVGINAYNFPDMKWQTTTNISSKKIWGTILLQQANFKANGNFNYQDQIFSLNNLVAKSDLSEKQVSIIYNGKQNRLISNFSFRSDDIKDLQSFLPFLYHGSANIEGSYVIENIAQENTSLENSKPKNSPQKNLTRKNSKLQKIAINTTVSLKNIESGYLKVSTLDAKLDSPDIIKYQFNVAEVSFSRLIKDNLLIKKGDLQISKLQVSHLENNTSNNILNGVHVSSKFNGNILSSNETGKSLPIELMLQQNIIIHHDNQTTFDITNLEGSFNNAKIILTKPSTIELFLRQSILSKLQINIPELKIDKGTLSVSGTITPDNLNIQSSLADISPNILRNLFTDEFSKAQLNGEITLTGSMASPQLDSSIKATNITTSNRNEYANALLNSKITSNKLESSINIGIKTSDGNIIDNIAHINATIPISFKIDPFIFEIHQNKNFTLDYTTKEKFNILSLLTLTAGHKLSGILDGNLSVRGTLKKPNINGNLKLSDGKYSYKTFGIKTKNISAQINPAGNKIFFKDIKIEDYFAKVINGNGELTINDIFPYNFSFETMEFNLLNNIYIQGVVSGQVTLNGDIDGLKAKGNCTIGPMEIKIPERFNESFSTINVTEVIEENSVLNAKADAQDTLPEDPEQIKSPILKLNINASTNDKVFVRGWGVSTRLKGDLQIKGTSDNPKISGKLFTVKGKYNQFGKQLDITEGMLTFDGPIPPSPYLNIIGTFKDEANEIRLSLEGPMLTPAIKISSTPAMPDENALSILLFGSNPEDISAFQAFQLANSLRKISGKGRAGIDPFEASRKALRVDEIKIKQDSKDSSNTSIGFGKYLSDKFYIEIEQGFQEGTKTKIEVELSPKINLEGSTESTGNSNIGINWRYDY